jgi:hypothetical protein
MTNQKESRSKQINRYVRCINNKRFLFFKNEPIRDEELSRLIVGHVYKVAPPEANDGDDLRIIDESGEDYLYPASYFEPLSIDTHRHNKTISTHLPEWLYGVLYAEAVAADKSVSALMREWLEERLDLPA